MFKDSRMAFGFSLLALMGGLAFAVSIGKVEAATSHGFDQILDILKVMSGAWVVWAFNSRKPEDKEQK